MSGKDLNGDNIINSNDMFLLEIRFPFTGFEQYFHLQGASL